MTNRKFHKLFGGPPRKPEAEITQRDMDLAASVQQVVEEVVVKMARAIAQEYGEKNLCLAGGVALNCVINGILERERIFENIWIQPAAGDAGGAIGAALAAWHLHFGNEREVCAYRDGMNGSYLGPEFTDDEIELELKSCEAIYTKKSQSDLISEVASALASGKAIGWMQGRMEFGPRALGARSIIADPRSHVMQRQLNLKVKFRESFRPFAPSVLMEDVSQWFEHNTASPYMLLVAGVKDKKRYKMTVAEQNLFGIAKLNIPRSTVPAVTHVDYSARIQTVHADTNSLYHAVISKFKEMTGCPLVVNTSFNVRGEPIVCTPTDAFRCFMGTGLDVLCIGNYLLLKSDQDQMLVENYSELYELD